MGAAHSAQAHTMDKLGDAILQLPGAELGHVPDLWREQLLRAMGSDSRASLAQTCKTAFTLLLSESEHAVLVAPIEPGADLEARIAGAKLALVGRAATKQSTVALVQGRNALSTDDWYRLRSASEGFALLIRADHIQADILAYASQTFGNIVSLDLSNLSNDGTMALLPPSALPKLRRLAIGRVAASAQDTVWATVVLYLPQLTSLSNQPLQAIMAAPGSARWTRAFGVVSHTLTHVELPCGLEPWIVTKLQQNAPGLQELVAPCIDPYPFASGQQPPPPICSWRTLTLKDTALIPFPVHCISWLPLPAEGKLVLKLPGSCPVSVSLPLSTEAQSKLQRVDIQRAEGHCFPRLLTIAAGGAMPAAQPAALHTALSLLPTSSPLRPPDTKLQLSDFTMSDALTTEILAVAADYPHITLLETTWPQEPLTVRLPPLQAINMLQTAVDDSILRHLLHGLSSVDTLCVKSMCVVTALPEGTELPWRQVKLWDGIEVGSWLRQVQLLGSATSWELNQLIITLTPEQVNANEHELMIEQLSTLRIVNIGRITLSLTPGLSLEDQTYVFKASLCVASAIPHNKAFMLQFHGWTATPELVHEFVYLPPFQSLTLTLHSAERPEGTNTPWPLAQAFQRIPRSYIFVTIGAQALQRGDLDAFVSGAPSDRTSWNEGLKITVEPRMGEGWLTDMRARLAGRPQLTLIS